MTVDLLVAGGGMAGMAAAARAVDLGLEVVVVEKSDAVGGAVGGDRVDGARSADRAPRGS
jgi:phytoene dehydrogenase-like protein